MSHDQVAHNAGPVGFQMYTLQIKLDNKLFSRVDKQRNEPGRWKSCIVATFLLFLTLLHVLT